MQSEIQFILLNRLLIQRHNSLQHIFFKQNDRQKSHHMFTGKMFQK